MALDRLGSVEQCHDILHRRCLQEDKITVALNMLGIRTIQSCEGHLDWGLPYLWFTLQAENEQKFLLYKYLSQFYKDRTVNLETLLIFHGYRVRSFMTQIFQDFFAFQAGLSFFHQLWLEGPLSFARHVDLDLALLSLEGFLALPIASLAGLIALACLFWRAQVRVQFCFQAAFNNRFGQLFEQATFP